VVHDPEETPAGSEEGSQEGTLILSLERCKACGFCIFTCPRGAIEQSAAVNSSGYATIAVDSERCTLCGNCYTVCPDGVFELKLLTTRGSVA
jgi:2-oxoglutarate ferredoxin oxidoreductase subunit delta